MVKFIKILADILGVTFSAALISVCLAGIVWAIKFIMVTLEVL